MRPEHLQHANGKSLLKPRVANSEAHLLLVFITLVWGATFVLVKAALHFVTPVLFVALRMALAATVLAVIYSRHLSQLTRASIMNGAVVGVFLFLGYFFQTTGLD